MELRRDRCRRWFGGMGMWVVVVVAVVVVVVGGGVVVVVVGVVDGE